MPEGRILWPALSIERDERYCGQGWNEWIEDYIDFEDELEIRLSKMQPEDIVREYFKAVDERDEKIIRACTTRENQLKYLSIQRKRMG